MVSKFEQIKNEFSSFTSWLTALRKGMDKVIKNYPNADFFEIVFEIEKTRIAPMSQIYMPLEMTNFLIRLKNI